MKAIRPWILAAALLVGRPGWGTIILNPWLSSFKGVDYTTAQADTNEVRQQKVFAFRVDLQDPGVELFSTPSNGDGPLETYGQTTTAFVNTYGVKLGLNANFFSPVSTIPNDPRELSGLVISRGQIVSPFESGRPALLITRSNKASIVTSDQASYSNYWTAVAGSDRILINGVPQKANCTTDFCNENPRSAVGISSNGRYLYLMVIDGRQPGWSDGATLYETGQWLLRLGCWNGLNLDGGGSTALAKIENGSAVLLNKPSGGIQRVNGNHLGLFTAAAPPVIITQPASVNTGLGQSAMFRVSAGGTTPLRYQWRFNGANLSSATLSAYTRSNLQLSHCGYYSVVVTNTSGAVTSSAAMLVLTNPPAAPRFTSAPTVSNNQVRLSFAADPGRLYALQTSSNLVQWLTVSNIFTLQSTGSLMDTPPAASPVRYYRLRWSFP